MYSNEFWRSVWKSLISVEIDCVFVANLNESIVFKICWVCDVLFFRLETVLSRVKFLDIQDSKQWYLYINLRAPELALRSVAVNLWMDNDSSLFISKSH